MIQSRPDYCHNCGSSDVKSHTGSYCEECGEPLFRGNSGETMTKWLQKHTGTRMRHPRGKVVYTIEGTKWISGTGGFHKMIIAKNEDGEERMFSYFDAKMLVDDD